MLLDLKLNILEKVVRLADDPKVVRLDYNALAAIGGDTKQWHAREKAWAT